jgi:hypothetical protein
MVAAVGQTEEALKEIEEVATGVAALEGAERGYVITATSNSWSHGARQGTASRRILGTFTSCLRTAPLLDVASMRFSS